MQTQIHALCILVPILVPVKCTILSEKLWLFFVIVNENSQIIMLKKKMKI